jgi:4-hydroxy-2-oxoheptanedioate aldolase
MIPNRFKASLTQPPAQPPAQPPLGTWFMSAAPAVAEALGNCGFDFLVIDMEHSPIDIAETIALLRTIAGTPAESLVRLAWNDQIRVKQVLDAGARNLLFPYVQNAAEGVRGVAAVHRGSAFGQTKDYLKNASSGIAVIIQLETPESIELLPEIAAVPGVDSLFVGPGDLSAAMGRIGEVAHPDVQALIAKAAKAARAAGKPIGIVGPNPDMVSRFVDYGYTWVAVASDLGMLTGRATDWIGALRKRAPAAAATSAY